MEGKTENLSNLFHEEKISLANFLGSKVFLVAAVVTLGFGIVSGYLLAGKSEGGLKTKPDEEGVVSVEKIKVGAEFGSEVQKSADTTIGTIEKGGIDGEGTHKLLREGGPSQTAYLTSSALDLDQFVGHKVQIWGETNKGQKAGWLMDVIRVKILE